MKNQFAKLFDFPEGQLLLVVSYDPFKETHQVELQTANEHLDIKQTVHGKLSVEHCRDIMEHYDEKKARRQFERLQKLMTGSFSQGDLLEDVL